MSWSCSLSGQNSSHSSKPSTLTICRNVCRVLFTLSVLVLSKMVDSPKLLQMADIIPANISTENMNLTLSGNMPMMCEIVSMADHMLMIILMFYLASLSLYVFCRKPNPSITTTSDMTLRVKTNLNADF